MSQALNLGAFMPLAEAARIVGIAPATAAKLPPEEFRACVLARRSPHGAASTLRGVASGEDPLGDALMRHRAMPTATTQADDARAPSEPLDSRLRSDHRLAAERDRGQPRANAATAQSLSEVRRRHDDAELMVGLR